MSKERVNDQKLPCMLQSDLEVKLESEESKSFVCRKDTTTAVSSSQIEKLKDESVKANWCEICSKNCHDDFNKRRHTYYKCWFKTAHLLVSYPLYQNKCIIAFYLFLPQHMYMYLVLQTLD